MKALIDNLVANSYDPDRSEDINRSAHERLLTVQDISDILKVPKSYVYWLTHQKMIPHIKIHGHLRFSQAQIDDWLKTQEVQDVGIQEAK